MTRAGELFGATSTAKRVSTANGVKAPCTWNRKHSIWNRKHSAVI